ncbi:MAG TPA: hypothetical protein VGB74_02155 [Actinoplanes sp.]
MPADLPERQRDRLTAKQRKPPDLVVVQALGTFTCAACGRTDGDLLMMEDADPGLPHLRRPRSPGVPAGRRRGADPAGPAGQSLSAVVVRFSRPRKRYERRGLLVEEAAAEQAEQAEQQCLSDEEARARGRERDGKRREAADEQFQQELAEEIGRLFPGCPPPRAATISRHAGARGSGRVGRSAAGRALDPDAVTGPWSPLARTAVQLDDMRHDRLRA